MYQSIPMTSLPHPFVDHPPPYEAHLRDEDTSGSQLLTSSTSNQDTGYSLDVMIANTESVMGKSRMVYGADNHPGYQQLQELLRLLRDPVFAEIYRFNLQNKDMFSSSQADSSALPEHFYRVHFPARPGNSWGFSIAATELNGDPSEVSLPEHETLSKLVVGGIQPEENDPQEANLRNMINPGDELIQINGKVVAGPKELKAQTQLLSGRHQPTTFVFLQIKPNEMNNLSMLRFQEQRLVLNLQSIDQSFGFAIVTNLNHRMTTIQKIVPEGAAHMDGRLRKGDILEYINKMSVAGLNSTDVVALLKSSGPQVTLTVLRYERLDYPIKFEKHLFQFYHVSLSKRGGSLGINIRSLPSSSDMSDQRLFIKDLVPGSVADVCGLIQPMDQIIAVNGHCISHLNKDDSLNMLKQEDQVHVTFLREIEPLPFSVNNTKLESSINHPSREERILFYRETLSDKFLVADGEILFHDLKTQMKQFRAKDGSISHIIENATPARNFPTFSKSVSTCALEPGDEILEVDGVQTRDNPLFTLEAFQQQQQQSYGYSFDSDRKIYIIYARPIRSPQQANVNIRHARERSIVSDSEGILSSNPQLSTFAGSNHMYTIPNKHNPIPLQENQQEQNDSERSNDTENFDSFEKRNQSTERLIKQKNPNLPFDSGAQVTNSEEILRSQEEISAGHQMFFQTRLDEAGVYNRLANPASPTSPNRYKNNSKYQQPQAATSPVNTSLRKNLRIATPSKDTLRMQASPQYDCLRKSMMSEYQAPMSSSDEEEGDAANDTLSVCNESMWDSNVVYCTLQKEAGKNLGITICQKNLDNKQPTVIIDQVMPGGVAEKSKVLSSHDRIVQVQRYDTRKCTPEEFVDLISSIPSGKITLGIQKYTGADNEDQPTASLETDTIGDDVRPLLEQNDGVYDVYQMNDDDDATVNNEDDAFRVRSLQRTKGAIDLRNIDSDNFVDRRGDETESVSTVSEAQNENYRNESEKYEYIERLDEWPDDLRQVIRIERRHKEPMGMGLVSAEEVVHFAPRRAGMYIRAITEEGLIGRDGRLNEGDFLIGINGHDLSGVSLNELAAFMQKVASLKSFKNFVELVFVPGDIAQQFLKHQQTASGQESFTSQSNFGSTSLSPRGSPRPSAPSREMPGAEAYMEEQSGTDQSQSNSLNQVGKTVITDDVYDSLNYQDPYSSVYSSMWEQATFGEKRLLEITRLEGQPLGLSIVDYPPLGIIVQSVQEGSPADLDRPDRIQPWDRLTSINGIDLTNVTKDQAIEVIKGAKSPMRFVVEAVIFVENFNKPSRLSKHISDEYAS